MTLSPSVFFSTPTRTRTYMHALSPANVGPKTAGFCTWENLTTVLDHCSFIIDGDEFGGKIRALVV